jgi:hypothetical protein
MFIQTCRPAVLTARTGRTQRRISIRNGGSRMNPTRLSILPVLENLEGRTLFAAAPPVVTAVLEGTLVVVNGTRKSDAITVGLNGGNVEVLSAGVLVSAFPAGGLTGLSVTASNGHDTVLVDAAVTLPVTLLGGNGRDSLTGGAGADTIDGGNGKDVLAGGAGNDTVMGGNASDVLDGGDGNDVLTGGRGRDQVTGGPGTDSFTGDKATEILEKAEDEVILPPVKGKGRK